MEFTGGFMISGDTPLLHRGKGGRQHDLVRLGQQAPGTSSRRPHAELHGFGPDRRTLVKASICPDMDEAISLS